MSQTLGFSVVQKSSAFKNYFATYHLTTALEATQLLPYLSQLRPFLNQFLIAQLVEHHGLKIFPILFAVYRSIHSKRKINQNMFSCQWPSRQSRSRTTLKSLNCCTTCPLSSSPEMRPSSGTLPYQTSITSTILNSTLPNTIHSQMVEAHMQTSLTFSKTRSAQSM